MLIYFKTRIRLRGDPQSPKFGFGIFQHLILRCLLFQLLIVSPTQNVPTRSRSSTEYPATSQSVTVAELFKDITVGPPIRAQRFTQSVVLKTFEDIAKGPLSAERFIQNEDDSASTSMEGKGVEKTHLKFPTRKLGHSTPPMQSARDPRNSTILTRGIHDTGRIETSGYPENNVTKIAHLETSTAILKIELGEESVNNDSRIKTKADNSAQKNFSPHSKPPDIYEFNLTDTQSEEFDRLNCLDFSNTSIRGISSAREKISKNCDLKCLNMLGKSNTANITAKANEDGLRLKSSNSSSSSTQPSGDSTRVSKNDTRYTITTHPHNLHTKPDFTSCVKRCGEDISFPCSCDEKCVVFKTCCEDMVKVCPQLFSQAERKFQDLLFAQIRCDPTLVVLMVESCPTGSHGTENIIQSPFLVSENTESIIKSSISVTENTESVIKSPIPVTENTESVIKSPIHVTETTISLDEGKSSKRNTLSITPRERNQLKNNAEKPNQLSEILSNAPVTDFVTGIIYANASILNCNKQASHQMSNSTGTPWDVQAGTTANYLPSDTMRIVHEKIDLLSYSYTPPPGQPNTAGSLCYTNLSTSCINDLSVELGIEPMICNLSINDYYNIVKTFRFFTPSDTSALGICIFCMFRQSGAVGYQKSIVSGLRVLMSLSEVPGKVKYALDGNPKVRGQSLPWSSWTCDVTDGALDQEDGVPCQVLACNTDYKLTEGGICRKAVNAEFAMQDAFLFNGRVCRIDADILAEVALCYLKQFANLGATGMPYRSFQVFQDNLNLTMAIIRMKMHVIDQSNRQDHDVLKESLSQAMLLFVRQHCSEYQQDIGRKSQFPYTKSLSNRRQKTLASPNIAWSRAPNRHVIKNINISDIPSSIIFTYCLQLHETRHFLATFLDCFWYGETTLGSANKIRIQGNVSEIANRKCLKKNHVHNTASEVGKLIPSVSVKLILVLVTLVEWMK